MKKARFGVRLPVAGPLSSVAAMTRVAREAEAMGFDSVWVHDYLVWTKTLDRLHISCGSREAIDSAGDVPPIFYESITNLAYLAGVTNRIRLGVAVLCLPYRQPLATAKQLANVDQLSEGRLELGIGQGAAKSTLNEEFEVMGIPRATKVRQTREALAYMVRVWNEDAPSLDGEFFRYGPATVYPKPLQLPHPPIWIGGMSDKSLDMVADYADGWLSFWVTPAQFPAAITNLHERLVSRGRRPEDLTVGTEIQVMVSATTDEARHGAERTMGVFDEAYAGTTGRLSEEGVQANSLQEIWNSSLIGSSEAVRDQVGVFLDAGCTFFELKFIYHDIDHLLEQMRSFANVVAAAYA